MCGVRASGARLGHATKAGLEFDSDFTDFMVGTFLVEAPRGVLDRSRLRVARDRWKPV